MIENTKCECGHQNHLGTVLCEACGKPLFDIEGTAPLEMRYDGVARRSQRDNPTWLDKVWNFFSSVRIAVMLIFLTLICSVLGTIYPQENTLLSSADPGSFYRNTYGTLGTVYYFIGLSHTYETWWFKSLLVMIGTSLVICSLDRVLPLYRALSMQRIRKHLAFIERQKVVYTVDLFSIGVQPADEAGWIQQLGTHLKRRHYRVHIDGTAMMAEKQRFSRWGPYINHIGLIIFLLAVLMRSFPGWYMDEYMNLLEGETKQIPNTHYYLKNEEFKVETYTDAELSAGFKKKEKVVDKLYQTTASLFECTADCDDPSKEPQLRQVTRQNIIVNHPLDYKGLLAYQFHYEETPQLRSVKASLKNKQSGAAFGSFTLEMKNPQPLYNTGPYRLELKDYYPEFIFENGKPATKSREPRNPAFVFIIKGPDIPKEGHAYIYFPLPADKQRFDQDRINGEFGTKFEISVNSMKDVDIAVYTTFLNIRVDRALPYIYTGAIIFMIGVIMGLYWQHRRIWLRIDDGYFTLGAYTNKNWYGLKHDVSAALAKMQIEVDPKLLENGVKQN